MGRKASYVKQETRINTISRKKYGDMSDKLIERDVYVAIVKAEDSLPTRLKGNGHKKIAIYVTERGDIITSNYQSFPELYENRVLVCKVDRHKRYKEEWSLEAIDDAMAELRRNIRRNE